MEEFYSGNRNILMKFEKSSGAAGKPDSGKIG
jgi:hypothetical protein